MTKPTGITVNRSRQEVIVQWGDGHTSLFTFSFLRRVCPCAECRGGHDQMGLLPGAEVYALPPEDTPAMRLRKLEPVGTYGVTIEWEDGHHYGIYQWQFLRDICPCAECRAQAEHGG